MSALSQFLWILPILLGVFDAVNGTCMDARPSQCGYWHSQGYCASYRGFMKINCQKTCNFCDDGNGGGNCTDTDQMCPQWASNGECQRNSVWMKANCKKSCKSCDGGGGGGGGGGSSNCTDTDQIMCPQWAKGGYCLKSDWMKANCNKSCKSCGGGGGGGGSSFAKEALNRHNHYRLIHNAPAMTLDAQMSQSAQAYSYKFASYGTIVHASHAERNGNGENLAIVCGKDQSATAAVEMWYKEVCLYNFNYGGMSGATGHFTQLVWKDSVYLGIGKAPGQYMGWPCTYWVARYKTHGNMPGQFRQMVDKGSFNKYSYCKYGR